MKVVILSGGLGTQLRPLINTGVKQLIPIANKPVLEYCIEDLKETGIIENDGNPSGVEGNYHDKTRDHAQYQ